MDGWTGDEFKTGRDLRVPFRVRETFRKGRKGPTVGGGLVDRKNERWIVYNETTTWKTTSTEEKREGRV